MQEKFTKDTESDRISVNGKEGIENTRIHFVIHSSL